MRLTDEVFFKQRKGIIFKYMGKILLLYNILSLAFMGISFKSRTSWASLVAQWLRIRLPMQGTRIRALVQEDPTCRGATKPVRHNYWACALEPASHNYWARVPQLLSPRATTTEVHVPRARALQQEKPPQWEVRAPQRRVAPARLN